MGNSQSNFKIYCKLNGVMPPVNKHGGDGPLTGWFDKTQKPFASDKDRDQFIYATITVMSQNGSIDLNDHAFRLLYSRRENDRLVARIVAEKEGVVKAQIEPDSDGKDQAEAFLALRRHIEIELDHILRDIPGAASSQGHSDRDNRKAIAGPSVSGQRCGSAARSPPTSPATEIARPISLEMRSPSAQNATPMDAPPAYGKAVKEWRTDEKKN